MFRRNHHLSLAAVVALVSLLGACSKGAPGMPSAQSIEKTNAYIACFNAVEGPVREGYLRYISWMKDPEAGPAGTEKGMRGPGVPLSHNVDRCEDPIVAALAMVPADVALDPVARAYQQRFLELHALIEQVDRYYTREDYLRDDRAGVRNQHDPLMQAYAAFFQAGTVMNAALDAREDERRQAQLDDIEADQGRSAAYYQLKILGDGKQLVTQLGGQSPDLALARARLADFQALLKQAQADRVGQGDAMWGYLERAADVLARDAGRRVERLQANKPLTQSEQMLMQRGGRIGNPQGSAEELNTSYNDLVAASNRLSRIRGSR